MRTIFAATLLLMGVAPCPATPWFPFGPNGGDARAFAVDTKDPAHLYLGTVNGWVYESRDAGRKWSRLARVGKRDDLVIDNIVVDPQNGKHLLVGAWALGDHADGGVFVSHDSGATWVSQPELRGQSVLALANAPSDPNVVVAGTLDGVYRSTDSGGHWGRISPAGDKEIHNIESLAIDPKDPLTIYAGTWHLPWKTIDGGEHWENIKQGVIEDSDVFSIIVDPEKPNVVYASACSGIYKSEDAGGKFVKVQGIPSTARRTRVLMQDPRNLDRVFAGTTEGLFRTENAGKSWMRMTGGDVIVNDVYVDPAQPSHVLLATDRRGVLASEDGGTTFESSNDGFSARQITAYTADSEHPGRLYVGVVNDKASGGVFVSGDGGLSWIQESAGLEGRDVFSLAQASDGTILAGTGHGIFRLKDGLWQRAADMPALPPVAHAASAPARRADATPVRPRQASAGKKEAAGTSSVQARNSRAKKKTHGSTSALRLAASHTNPKRATQPTHKGAQVFSHDPRIAAPLAAVKTAEAKGFDGSVYSIARSGDVVFAATSQGVLMAGSDGASWKTVTGLESQEWRFVAAAGQAVIVANLKKTMLSKDLGSTWSEVLPPAKLSQISSVAVDGQGGLWVGGREGIFLSSDSGSSWETLPNLYVTDVNSIFYDQPSQRMMVTAFGKTTIAFGVSLPTKKVSYWDTGWNLRFVRPIGDHLIAATLFDGMVLEPRMVDSAERVQP